MAACAVGDGLGGKAAGEGGGKRDKERKSAAASSPQAGLVPFIFVLSCSLMAQS